METDSFSNLNDGDKDKNKEVDLFSSGSLLTSLPCIDLHPGLKICSLILNLEKLWKRKEEVPTRENCKNWKIKVLTRTVHPPGSWHTECSRMRHQRLQQHWEIWENFKNMEMVDSHTRLIGLYYKRCKIWKYEEHFVSLPSINVVFLPGLRSE